MTFDARRAWPIGLVVATVLIASCQSQSQSLGTPPSCTDKCTPSAVGGQGATGAGGAGGAGNGVGGAVAGSLSGSVVLLTDETFAQSAPYNNKATIIAGQVEVEYANAAMGFDLEGLVAGTQWVLVRDETNGGSGILSTFSPQLVPSAGATLPVVDAQVMNKIASDLPIQTAISSSAAQLILFIEHEGAPFVGVSVAASGPGGIIAYDQGPGIYSNQASGTGTAGVIVILNAPVSGAGTVSFSVVDSTAKSYSLAGIPVSAGAATFAGFTL